MCSEPAYARNFLTVVTCTTPFVKGKILVIAKHNQVGATLPVIRALNRLDERYLGVTKNKSGVMSGELHCKKLLPKAWGHSLKLAL